MAELGETVIRKAPRNLCAHSASSPVTMKPLIIVILSATLLATGCLTTPPAKPIPAAKPSGFENRKFLALPLEEAVREAERRKLTWRIAERDGEKLMLTEDYRPNRVNFKVRNGFVVEVFRG